jgi:hypothetical protein
MSACPSWVDDDFSGMGGGCQAYFKIRNPGNQEKIPFLASWFIINSLAAAHYFRLAI